MFTSVTRPDPPESRASEMKCALAIRPMLGQAQFPTLAPDFSAIEPLCHRTTATPVRSNKSDSSGCLFALKHRSEPTAYAAKLIGDVGGHVQVHTLL